MSIRRNERNALTILLQKYRPLIIREERYGAHIRYARYVASYSKIRKFLGSLSKRNVRIKRLPRISIYTSVYDGAASIYHFLDDLKVQTIFDNKCELILVHPRTSPGYQEERAAIQRFRDKKRNVKYIPLETDPGIYSCWNIALREARGEYVTNANLDDRKSPISLESHALELLHNQAVDLVYADSYITNVLNEKYFKNSSGGKRYNFPEYSAEVLALINFPHQCPMYRRSLHDRFGYFDESYRFSGDWEFWLRCASAGATFKKLDKVLNLYCWNEKGLTTDPRNETDKNKEEESVYAKYASKLV